MAKSKKSITTQKQNRLTEDAVAKSSLESSFVEVIEMIQQARLQAFQAVNTILIDLYWRVGEYISHKLETSTWGESVVDELLDT